MKKTISALLILTLIASSLSLLLSSCGKRNEAPQVTEVSTDKPLDFESIKIDSESESETSEPETDPPVTEPPETTPPVTNPPETTPPAPVSGDAFSGCLFIGDSRTEGLEMTSSLPGADIFATTGMSIFGATSGTVDNVAGVGSVTIPQLLASRSYSKVYILLGINEIGYATNGIVSKFSELISTIQSAQPGAKIIIQANLHVTTSRSSWGDSFNNTNINTLNAALKGLTNGSTILWIDANTILDDSTGGLAEEYSGGDGIHLNWNSYSTWGNWIAQQNGTY